MWERKTFERFRDRAAVLFFFPVSDEHLVTRSPLSGSNRLYSRCRLLCASTTLNQAIYRAPGKPDIRTAAAVAAGLDDGGGKRGRVR